MNDEKPVITTEESDSAKRLMDAVNVHVQASRALGRDRPGYVAIRLSDGSATSGDFYDSRRDAVRFNLHDPNVFFLKVGKDTMPFREALLVLQQHRQARKMGVVFQTEELVTPHLTELLAQNLPRTLKGLNGG